MSNLLSKINDIQSVCEAVIKKMAKYVEAEGVDKDEVIVYLASRIGTIKGLAQAAKDDAARLINYKPLEAAEYGDPDDLL